MYFGDETDTWSNLGTSMTDTPQWPSVFDEVAYNDPLMPSPIAREQEWFFNSLGMSRENQARLALASGIGGAIMGLAGLIVLFGTPNSYSPLPALLSGTIVAALGFCLAVAAFRALRESAGFAEIEFCSPKIKAAAAISIVVGFLIVVCLVTAAAALVVAFEVTSAVMSASSRRD